MQREQRKRTDGGRRDRLWVFRSGSLEATWGFLSWLKHYERSLRRRLSASGLGLRSGTVKAFGTTIFIDLQWMGDTASMPWNGAADGARWLRRERQVIAWIEDQVAVACVQPRAPRRPVGQPGGSGRFPARSRRRRGDSSLRASGPSAVGRRRLRRRCRMCWLSLLHRQRRAARQPPWWSPCLKGRMVSGRRTRRRTILRRGWEGR